MPQEMPQEALEANKFIPFGEQEGEAEKNRITNQEFETIQKYAGKISIEKELLKRLHANKKGALNEAEKIELEELMKAYDIVQKIEASDRGNNIEA